MAQAPANGTTPAEAEWGQSACNCELRDVHFARLNTRLGVKVPCGVVIEAEACTNSSPFTVTDAFLASPSKFGVVARSAVTKHELTRTLRLTQLGRLKWKSF